MTEERPVRILIVDDHGMVRSGLKNFILAYDWMIPVGEAANGAQAVEFCATQPVDVVLMDIIMPEMDGTEATQKIVALGKPINIIIITSFHEQEQVENALKAGATSYLLKNVTAGELAQAIKAAHAGRPVLAQEATRALINATREKQVLGSDLTERELEVLGLLVKGLSNSEIAARLCISNATIKFHLSNIFSKLGAKSRIEAATIALKYNLASAK